MKLRIRGNSIRLRLTKTEIVQFANTGRVEEVVEFGFSQTALRYQLYTTTNADVIRAKFEDNCLSILVPKPDAENWINSEKAGIETRQPLDENRYLRILLEKDFACLTDRADEDETDAFPNPLANSKPALNC